jgi:hypothetical protein
MAQSALPAANDPAIAGTRLRQLFLSTTCADLSMAPSADFPRVFGVAMDWRVGPDHIATVISAKDGSASVYTNSTFGILGGIGHEQVRAAAQAFVRTAEQFVDGATPVSAFPYPDPRKVYFYILTYDGVRFMGAEADKASGVAGSYASLFYAGHAVLTELRNIVVQREV